MDNEPLRIGRITRSAEKSLGISLTGSVLIYMEGEALDRLAAKRPDDYLSYIQELESILKEPDFVAFDQENERMVFTRGYFRNAAWSVVYLCVEKRGTPSRWTFAGISTGAALPLPKAFEDLRFVRVINNKNVSKAKS